MSVIKDEVGNTMEDASGNDKPWVQLASWGLEDSFMII